MKIKPSSIQEFVGQAPSVTGRCRYLESSVHPNYYRGVAIDQPNLMVVGNFDSEVPLFGTELAAWYLARVCLELVKLPDGPDEMRRLNYEQAIKELQEVPVLRMDMDEDNFMAHSRLGGDVLGEKKYLSSYWDASANHEDYRWRVLAQIMRDMDYPLDIGNSNKLNDKGKALIYFDELSTDARIELVDDEHPWRTFRDMPADWAAELYSIHTGTLCVPLPDRWEIIDTAQFVKNFKESLMNTADEDKKQPELEVGCPNKSWRQNSSSERISAGSVLSQWILMLEKGCCHFDILDYLCLSQ